MDIQKLTAFFMWCTIIDGALLVVSIGFFLLAPDWTYQMQATFFPITQANFNVVMYGFLGLFKIAWLVFNVVPYVALLIVRRK
ncbi:MAG: hypothetical protein QF384_00365 [Alphaproteobacteria bacterium]|jgi:hypothetical protein|nr:hypothetical protein [Alphaproteobacteria bacterium]